MRPALCLESSLPCQAGLASGPTSLPRTQQSRSVGAAVTTPAHPPTALGGRESGYPISQTKKRRLRKVAGVLGLGDPVAKPALQRHCHAKPWLGAAPSGPQLRPQSPVLGAREGHPPAGSTGPGARRCLESGLSGPQSPVRGEGAPRAGKEAPKSGQIEGTVPTPPTAWRRCPGSLRERKRQGAGCRSLRPTLCLLHWTDGPPLPGSINTPAPTTPHAAGHGQAPLEANRNHGFGGAGSPSQPSPPPHQQPNTGRASEVSRLGLANVAKK